MDEIFGYFPPTANPPSKLPMLTLLKQARAFGLGIVLATQNPVDLDYKGLSNAGTWFLGRLQTKRDKERVLEGLEGASNAAGHSFDRRQMDEILSSLANRVFLMSNVHEDQPVVFQTRWALSYLRGPLTREQIQMLMAPRRATQPMHPLDPAGPSPSAVTEATPKPASASSSPSKSNSASVLSSAGSRPVVPPDVPEFFIPRPVLSDAGSMLLYRPAVLGVARLHYAEKKTGIDYWETLGLLRLVDTELPADIWSGAETHSNHIPELNKAPEAGARFDPLPGALARAKGYAEYTKALKNFLYRERKLTIWSCPDLKAYSHPEESQRDFRLRLSQGSREARDRANEELRAKYAAKRNKLQEDVRKARERLDREQAQASKAKWDAAVAFGNSVLGAFLGKKTVNKTNVGKATSAAKAASKAIQQSGDLGTAQSELDRALEDFTNLELEFQAEIERQEAKLRPDALVLEAIELTPRKTDITIEQVVLAWTPWTTTAGGEAVAAY